MQKRENVFIEGRLPQNLHRRASVQVAILRKLFFLSLLLLPLNVASTSKQLLSYSATFSDGTFNHGDTNHIFSGLGEDFKIFGQASKSAQPSKRSFDNPAFGNHLESVRRFSARRLPDCSILRLLWHGSQLCQNADLAPECKLPLFPASMPCALVKRIQGLFPHPALIPASVMVIHGVPRRKIQRNSTNLRTVPFLGA